MKYKVSINKSMIQGNISKVKRVGQNIAVALNFQLKLSKHIRDGEITMEKAKNIQKRV